MMKEMKTKDAVGQVLCHDITVIIKDVKKGVAFKKGHVIEEKDIEVLLSLGKDNIFIWEKEDGQVHENDAAQILLNLCADENMNHSDVSEGKIDISAKEDGLFVVNLDLLNKVNSLGEIIIATRSNYYPVKKNDKLAGTRVIPLIINEEKLNMAKDIVKDEKILSLHKFKPHKVGVIATGNEIYYKRIEDTFTPVIAAKLAEYGSVIETHIVLPDNSDDLTKTINEMLERNDLDMVICMGGMSVDPDDRTPLAIKNTGAEIISYGAPVLPGAMFLISYKNGKPILGLPGCVMYAKRTIFDLMLPRILAGLKISQKDLRTLGNGGLCLNCDECTFPNCGFGKGV